MATVWEERLSRFLSKFLALKESTGTNLLPDLMPVLPLHDATAAEELLLRNERLIGGSALVNGVALNYSIATIGPGSTSSHLLVTVERLLIQTAVQAQVLVGFVTTPAPNGGGLASAHDLRNPTTTPLCSFEASAIAVLPSAHEVAYFIGDVTPTQLEHAVVLPPGHYLQVSCLTVNTALFVSWQGRERECGPSEVGL